MGELMLATCRFPKKNGTGGRRAPITNKLCVLVDACTHVAAQSLMCYLGHLDYHENPEVRSQLGIHSPHDHAISDPQPAARRLPFC